MKHRFFKKAAHRINAFYPCYAWIPTAIVIGYSTIVFYGTRCINRFYPAHLLQTPLDKVIPFVPFFVLFYVLAYLQWGLGYFFALRHSRQLCYETLLVDLIAKTVCLICFLAFPTAIQRPQVLGTDPWSALVRLIYQIDLPNNLFPSLHCLTSWLLCRALWKISKLPLPVKLANAVLTLLICASTLLIKQHYLPDAVAGILSVELGYWLAHRIRPERLERLEPRFCKHFHYCSDEDLHL